VRPTPVGYLPGAGARAVVLAARGSGPYAGGCRIDAGALVVYARALGRVWCLACADGLVRDGQTPPWRTA
jgi:hypothetical protein